MQSGSMSMKSSLILRQDERPAFRKALEAAGFLVFEAAEGGRELERLRAFWAALILLDLPMPRMGGLEIVRCLRGTGDDIPATIIVTHGRIPDALTAVRLGADDVLAKPLTPKALHDAVEEILHRAAGARPGPSRPRIFVAVEPMVLDLLRAKQALDHREFDEAERLVRRAIDRDPDSAVAHNLMGVLHLRLGEHHASYRSFRAALRADRDYEPALENLRRHCDRFGLDFHRDGLIPVAQPRDRASDLGPSSE
jgi:DNA-binding response OmpR family regulator